MVAEKGKRGLKPKERILPYDWDDSEVITDWLSRITKKRNYARELSYFTDWIGMTPEEIIEERNRTLDKEGQEKWLEDKVKEYVDYCYKEKKLKIGTVKSYLRSISSFILHHFGRKGSLEFRRGEIKHREVEEVKDSYKPDWVLSNSEVRVLFNACRNNFDKAVLLALAQSGMSAVDVSEIKITDRLLKDIEDDKHYFFERGRSKTMVKQATFLSNECLFYTKLYLRRRKDYNIGDYLFVTQKGEAISTYYIYERFKGIAEIAFGEERAKDFLPKNLRDIMRNACLLSEVQPDIMNKFMGWSLEGAKDNYRITEEVMRVNYEKIFRYLTINGHNRDRSNYEELENTQKEQSEQIKALITTVNILQEKLDDTIEELQIVREKNLANITEYFGGEKGVEKFMKALLSAVGVEYPEGEGDFFLQIKSKSDQQ